MPCTRSALRSQAFPARLAKQHPCQSRTTQLALRNCSHSKQRRVLAAAQTSSRENEDALEDTAFLASVLGDTADRSPTKLSVSTRSCSRHCCMQSKPGNGHWAGIICCKPVIMLESIHCLGRKCCVLVVAATAKVQGCVASLKLNRPAVRWT